MANAATHALIGSLTGMAIVVFDPGEKHEIAHQPILAGACGVFFGKLPDILEPSLKNPHHRQFYHSLVVFSGLTYGMKKAYEWKPKSDGESFLRGLALVATGAYLSHLFIDSLTKRSLPLVGKI